MRSDEEFELMKLKHQRLQIEMGVSSNQLTLEELDRQHERTTADLEASKQALVDIDAQIEQLSKGVSTTDG